VIVACAVLRAVFFLSGACALVFETLWFRLTRLAFGNSVTASAVVLAAFMAGLGLGNAAAASRGQRVRRPIRAYAALELVIGGTGLGLVLALPHLARVLAPILGGVALESAALGALRLVLAFVLLLVPATAMGATLPLLVSALSRDRSDFGPVLGSLYGWNTSGAVAGALLGEWVLIPLLGVRGSGLAAALGNGTAALGALWIAGRVSETAAPGSAAPEGRLGGRALGLTAAAGLAGAILLGLEVVWFRFLQLFAFGTSRTFATLLAVVVLGIALGGFAASRWLAARPGAHRWRSALALAAGASTLGAYAGFGGVLSLGGVEYSEDLGPMLIWSAALMLPTCFASGALFTLLGGALREELGPAARAAGILTVANTLGAMTGPLVAGFLLLPRLGVEASLLVLGLGYAVVFAAALPREASAGRPRVLHAIGLLGFAGLAVAFPSGLMARSYLPRVVRRFDADASRLVAVREGQTETLLYLRKDLLGEPLSCRMLTNGFSMSGLGFFTERYMRSFVNWAVAVHPSMERALLISYGVGVTASALAEEASFRSIDVVDISRDVIEMSPTCLRSWARDPLRDPRVRVHIEDGRFFLLTTRQRFDLVTAEPPPPLAAGVESLYSREYFALVHDRLNPGGVVTYWLPVHSLDRGSALAIVRAFCDVFADCTLWNGAGYNWMLAGSRGGRPAVSVSEFSRQWADARVAESLAAIGLEEPGDLTGTFLGDAAYLDAMTRSVPPLVDDRPYRLSGGRSAASRPFFEGVMDVAAARARFAESTWASRVWPEPLRQAAPEAFVGVGLLNEVVQASYHEEQRQQLRTLFRALRETKSLVLPQVIVGSQPSEARIAGRARGRGEQGPLLDYIDAVGRLSRRDFAGAGRLFGEVLKREPGFARAAALRALSLCLAADAQGFRAQPRPLTDARDAEFWASVEPFCSGQAPPAPEQE
jgi:spermidine synthase